MNVEELYEMYKHYESQTTIHGKKKSTVRLQHNNLPVFKDENLNPLLLKQLASLLNTFKYATKLFNALGLIWSLSCGNLLGYYRNGKQVIWG